MRAREEPTLLASEHDSRKQVYVALDLETTGLDSQRDTIIEVGAVKFQGRKVLEEYHSLINPYRTIPEFVRRLTGIGPKDVDGAPSFGVVAGELSAFIADLPVVGHNISFDLEFLAKHGLRLINHAFDTYDLASIFLPRSLDYSLSQLIHQLGLAHPQPHRALPDAQAAYLLFTTMLELAQGTDPAALSFMGRLATRTQWPLGDLLLNMSQNEEGLQARVTTSPQGLEIDGLAQRLASPSRFKPNSQTSSLDEEELVGYLASNGLLAKAFARFEHRPQQIEMLRAVTGAFNGGGQLIMEGGTGVGKSLAYLLPAVLFSMKNSRTVVISTNTINLQEQLLQKDIPALVNILEEGGVLPSGEFRAVPLKGRNNYLCLRRWSHLSRVEGLAIDEARVLSKSLVWLQDTATGDRGEINLSSRDASIWNRISAGDREWCPGSVEGGICFLKSARQRASAAHIVVVNHALLLSDLKMGGGILPEYHHLIVDEAHHLEEEATHQLGLRLPQGRLGESLDILGRLLTDVRIMLRGLFSSAGQRQRGEALVSALEEVIPRSRDAWSRLWDAFERSLKDHSDTNEDRSRLRITTGIRAQPGWSDLEISWENVEVILADVMGRVSQLHTLLDSVTYEGPMDLSTVVAELSQWQEETAELRDQFKGILAGPLESERIDWISLDEHTGSMMLSSAPLNVGKELEKHLFAQKSCVVLTSATLTTQGSFDYVKERLSFSEAQELAVGSPFNYSQATLLLLPDDIPPPNAGGYKEALDDALIALGKALQGHTLVLFTSHSALRSTAQAVRGPLGAQDIEVLAQGVDGPPARLFRRFLENSESLLLGTSSFWEGVDLPGDVLKALVLVRLPFNVPTEPVFAARSELFEDPFHQYALPQAILRFRQGFGRLIRSSDDRGIVVVMDRRIVERSYGKAFLESLPDCTVRRVPLSAIESQARQWLRT